MNDTIFCPGAVVLEIKSRNKADAIQEVISRAQVFDDIPNKEHFTQAVFEREAQGPCVGHGTSFAHGKIPGIPEMKVALGVSRAGICSDSPEQLPIHLLFVVATNPAMHLDYLKRLSILAKMARREGFRNEILSCFAQEEAAQRLQRIFSLCESGAV
jgi:mannitol/fructose-specific phosphotransferase system IIA component (Ntr-type)